MLLDTTQRDTTQAETFDFAVYSKSIKERHIQPMSMRQIGMKSKAIHQAENLNEQLALRLRDIFMASDNHP